MSLAVSAEVEIAGSIGNVSNAANSPHSAAVRSSAAVEAELRSRWSTELATQTRQAAGEQTDSLPSASLPADSFPVWPDRLTGENQSWPSQIQEQGEGDGVSLGGKPALPGDHRTAAKDGSAPDIAANPATVSEKISDRVAASSAQSANRSVGTASKRGSSTPLAIAKTGSLTHKNGVTLAADDRKTGSLQRSQALPASSSQVSSPNAGHNLHHADLAGKPVPSPAAALVETATPRAGKSGILDGGLSARGDADSAIGFYSGRQSVTAALPTAISGLRSSTSTPQPGSSRDGNQAAVWSFPGLEGSSRGASDFAGSDRSNSSDRSTGLTGIDALSHGISGLPAHSLGELSVSRIEGALTADGEASGTVMSAAIPSTGATADGSSGLGSLLNGKQILASRVAMTAATTLPTGPGTIPAIQNMPLSVQLPSSQAVGSGEENASSARPASAGADSPAKLKSSDLPADAKPVSRSSMASGQLGSFSVSPSVSPGSGGAGVAHAGVFASAPAALTETLGTSGITPSGARVGSEGNGELSRNPFQALDASSVSDAMDGLNGLYGSQINAQGVAGRSSSLGGRDGVRTLEIGYQDPALGYVELRAHTEGSGIHASMVAQSAESGATLEAHLGSLAGWMNERRTPVETLTVSSLSPGHAGESGHSGPAQGDAQGETRGETQAGEQYRSSGWDLGEASASVTGTAAGSGSSRVLGLVASLTEELQLGSERSGSSISVLA